MDKTITYRCEDDDPALLKVSGRQDRDYVKKLANAIVKTCCKLGVAKLRSCAAPAVNNAEKAFIIAIGEAAKQGSDLMSRSYFVDLDFDGKIKTGIVKEVTAIRREQ